MRSKPEARTVLVAPLAAVLATAVLSGCGTTTEDQSEVRRTAAAVADQARSYLGDPWERRLRRAHDAQLARSYTGDPWEARLRLAAATAPEHVHDSWEGRIPGHEDETRCPLAP